MSHPPVYYFISRIVIITFAGVWSSVVFFLLGPVKSVNNLEAALIDCMTTTAKAFSSIWHAGVLDENGQPDCQIDEVLFARLLTKKLIFHSENSQRGNASFEDSVCHSTNIRHYHARRVFRDLGMLRSFRSSRNLFVF